MSETAAVKRIALVGNPNSGKTSLFNRLTGLRQHVGNYPGVTVDRIEGDLALRTKAIRVMDLPGTYSLEAISPDEVVTAGVLQGTLADVEKPDGVLLVVDSTTLNRSLSFVAEVLACELPTIVVLTMIDELKARGGKVDIQKLSRRFGCPVVGVVGNKGLGIDDLREVLELEETWQKPWGDIPEANAEAEQRFEWAERIARDCYTPLERTDSRTEKVDKVLLHPVFGSFIFLLMMAAFFQVIFAVAAPIQGWAEGAVGWFGEQLSTILPAGMFQSLLVDGIIAGVGGVVVFIPQIALLLLLIAILEGTGYMARAAFLIDRLMGWAGLEGRSFIALLSSYACAVPGIMATRSVPDPKARLTTILVAPFMTCSARLPVYALLIGAFIPAKTVLGFLQLQGLVLFGLYLLGSFSALIAAWVFTRNKQVGKTFPFYLELPPYRIPTVWDVLARMKLGVFAFLRKAGTIILTASVVLWVLMAFPMQKDAEGTYHPVEVGESYAASIGKGIEPAFEPLGYDWKISLGLIGSLAAREVIVSTLSQIYALDDSGGDGAAITNLGDQLRAEKKPDGTPAYTLATALSLLVFFVYSLQCVSTLAVMKRETKSWKWPAFAFAYMFVIAYVGAWLTYQVTNAIIT